MKKIGFVLLVLATVLLFGSAHAVSGFFQLENPGDEVTIQIPAGMRLFAYSEDGSRGAIQYYHKYINDGINNQKSHYPNQKYYNFYLSAKRNDRTLWASFSRLFKRPIPTQVGYTLKINIENIESVTFTERQSIFGKQYIKIKANGLHSRTNTQTQNSLAKTSTPRRTVYTRSSANQVERAAAPKFTRRVYAANAYKRTLG